MPPINLQQFLANASHRVIPDSRGGTVVNDIDTDLRAVIDLTPQSDQIEWDGHVITASVSGTQPQFSVPQTAIEAVTIYHHIAVQRDDNPDASAHWFISVAYPGIGAAIEVVNTFIDERRMSDLLASKFSSAAGTLVRNARPLIVWPRGSLIIQRLGTIGVGEAVRAQYVRQVKGGPATAEQVNDLQGGFGVP